MGVDNAGVEVMNYVLNSQVTVVLSASESIFGT